MKHFHVSSTNFILVNDPQTRLLLYKVATGKGHVLKVKHFVKTYCTLYGLRGLT